LQRKLTETDALARSVQVEQSGLRARLGRLGREERQESTQLPVLPPDLSPLPITVRFESGRTMFLEVSPTDRIEDVKAQIRNREGIPVGEQILVWGTELRNGNTIGDFGVQRDAVIECRIKAKLPDGSRQIVVHSLLGKKRFDLVVAGTDRISEVKEKITEIEGFPAERQRLIFASQRLDDAKTIDHYSIVDGSVLHLILQLQDDANAAESIPPGMRSSAIPSPRAIPSANAVQTPSAASQNATAYTIFVSSLSGNHVLLTVAPTLRIADVKLRICQKEGIPVARQRLSFEGRLLEDAVTLENYLIGPNATLQLAVGR
jgi:hypothetical protein